MRLLGFRLGVLLLVFAFSAQPSRASGSWMKKMKTLRKGFTGRLRGKHDKSLKEGSLVMNDGSSPKGSTTPSIGARSYSFMNFMRPTRSADDFGSAAGPQGQQINIPFEWQIWSSYKRSELEKVTELLAEKYDASFNTALIPDEEKVARKKVFLSDEDLRVVSAIRLDAALDIFMAALKARMIMFKKYSGAEEQVGGVTVGSNLRGGSQDKRGPQDKRASQDKRGPQDKRGSQAEDGSRAEGGPRTANGSDLRDSMGLDPATRSEFADILADLPGLGMPSPRVSVPSKAANVESEAGAHREPDRENEPVPDGIDASRGSDASQGLGALQGLVGSAVSAFWGFVASFSQDARTSQSARAAPSCLQGAEALNYAFPGLDFDKETLNFLLHRISQGSLDETEGRNSDASMSSGCSFLGDSVVSQLVGDLAMDIQILQPFLHELDQYQSDSVTDQFALIELLDDGGDPNIRLENQLAKTVENADIVFITRFSAFLSVFTDSAIDRYLLLLSEQFVILMTPFSRWYSGLSPLVDELKRAVVINRGGQVDSAVSSLFEYIKSDLYV